MILDYAHFLKYNTRSINNQRKIDKLDYPKQKLVCVKMQPGEWEKKISANHISDEGQASGIYKELLECNSKKTTQFLKGQRL